MKIRLIGFILLFVGLYVAAETTNDSVFVFEEYQPYESATTASVNSKSAETSLSSDVYGNFDVNYVETPTLEVLSSMRKAVELWSERLPIIADIVIQVEFAEKGVDAPLYTVTVAKKTFSGYSYPQALYKQLVANNGPQLDLSVYDMKIVFNTSINWDYNYNSSTLSDGKIDFTTSALRAIARGLGFGADLKMSRNLVSFNSSSTYPFNAIVVNDSGEILSDQPIRTTQIYNYVHSPGYVNVFENESHKNEYKLYTPEEFDKNLTFCYYDSVSAQNDEERIMMINGLKGKVYYIGDKIIDALNEIGWKDVPQLNIMCDKLPSTGIIAHNTTTIYSFYTTDKNLSNYNWSYSIPQDNGDYRVVASSTDSVFSFSLPGSYLNSDKRSSSNMIKGRVRLNAIQNDTINAIADKVMYVMYKPAKPLLIIDTIHTDEYSYDLHAKFYSQGATGYYVVTNYLDYGDAYGRYVNTAGVNSVIETYMYKGENISISVTGFNGNGNSEEASETVFATIDNYSSYSITDVPVIEYGTPAVIHSEMSGPLTDCNWEIRVYYNDGVTYELFPKNTTFETGSVDSLNIDLQQIVDDYGLPEKKKSGFFKQDENSFTIANVILTATDNNGETIHKTIPVKINMIPKKPQLEIIQKTYDVDSTGEGWCDMVITLRQTPDSPPASGAIIYRYDGGIEIIDLTIEEATNYSTWLSKCAGEDPGYMEYSFMNDFAIGESDCYYPFDEENMTILAQSSTIKPNEIIYDRIAEAICIKGESSNIKSAKIYNVMGGMYNPIFITPNKIDTSYLPNGIYIIELKDITNQSIIKRFFKY